MPIHNWSRVDAGIFHDLHLAWIAELRKILNGGLLPQPYYALAEPITGDIVPDLLTLRAREEDASPDAASTGIGREESSTEPVGGAPAGVVVQELAPSEIYAAMARRIVIKDEAHEDEVVAVIELVSRGNKSSRRERDRFGEKRLAILGESVNLVVVDLQAPTPLVPGGFHELVSRAYDRKPPSRPPDRLLEAVSYEVLETRAIRSHVVPLRCGDALPDMPVFLKPKRFVRLPLERTYTEAFQGVPSRFRRTLEADSKEA